MAVERNLLISILKLTKKGPVQRELVDRDARVPVQVGDEMLNKFSGMGLIGYRGRLIEVSSNQRARMAVRAVELGADPERVCRVLDWDEFEEITARAFEINNFAVKRRFRFKWAGRRWEMDVLGCKEPLVACVDCKHWHRGWRRSAIMKVVEAQVERTRALSEAFPRLHEKVGLANWRKVVLVPMVLSLFPGPFKFYNNVPVVPVLQLQSFLNELPAHIISLTRFSAHIS